MIIWVVRIMSLVSDEKLSKLTSTSNGKINSEVIEFAKTFLYSRLKTYVIDEKLLKIVEEKLKKINIKLVTSDEFVEIFHNSNGKGFLPGAFVFDNTIYFRNDLEFDKNEFHKLIHEMLHNISQNQEKLGIYKSGLYQSNKEKNYSYGYGFNEAFTEYLTSILLDEAFSGYSQDLNYVIQLFMLITDLKIEDLLFLYISKEEWCTENIINRFNPSSNDLVDLIVMYDDRLPQTRRKKFNPNNVLKIIFDSIKQKIADKEFLDTYNIQELLKQYYNYFSDWNLDNNTKQNMNEILDVLGTYNCKITR